jgi:hypothetical protein
MPTPGNYCAPVLFYLKTFIRMNKRTLFYPIFGLVFLVGTAYNPNNPPTSHTGAPGEATCGKSGCHSGGLFTGTVSIAGVPDTVFSNQTYPITVTQVSNAIRGGFQLTALDNNNAAAGLISTGTGVSVGSGNNRQYARQSTPKNLTAGSTSWTFNWQAPASAAGDKITFYSASLAANGNGNKSGDNPFTTTRSVVLKSTTSVEVAAGEFSLALFPNPASDMLQVDFPESGKARLEVYDIRGRLVLQQTDLAPGRVSIEKLNPGTHLAVVTAGGKSASRQFMVVR